MSECALVCVQVCLGVPLCMSECVLVCSCGSEYVRICMSVPKCALVCLVGFTTMFHPALVSGTPGCGPSLGGWDTSPAQPLEVMFSPQKEGVPLPRITMDAAADYQQRVHHDDIILVATGGRVYPCFVECMPQCALMCLCVAKCV